MKSEDQKLREALAALSTPRSEEAQAQAWAQARHAWRESRRAGFVAAKAAPRTDAGWFWTVPAAGVALVLIAVLMFMRTPPMAEGSGHLLAEMEKLFPGQVLAVVRQDQAVDLQLGDAPAPAPTDQALRVELVRGRQRVEVLTYSGRSVDVKMDGESRQFTPLLTGAGGLIILTGDQVIASGGQLDGFKISAQLLADNRS